MSGPEGTRPPRRDAAPGFLRRLLRSRRQLESDVAAEVRFHVEGRALAVTGAGVVVGLAAVSAAWLPARRASAVSPVEALRDG